MEDNNWETAVAVLRLSKQLVDDVQDGLVRRGFDDIRPAHGFAFVRISEGDATTSDVAKHLGVSKQAAGQLVEYLVDHGYVERTLDPRDARARLLALTDRGWACTAAAEASAAESVDRWRTQMDPSEFVSLQRALRSINVSGRLRPYW
jgi:DNA-binding MarR family transcriptional regulator